MNKRVWSIAVALVMLFSMICSVFVVSAADESASEGNAPDATVQLNNYASEQPVLFSESGSTLTNMAMTAEKSSFLPGEVIDVSVSLENYQDNWAIFFAELTYDPLELEYVENSFVSKVGDGFNLFFGKKSEGSLTVYMMPNADATVPANLPATDGSAALMDLQFRALKETESADITLSITEETVAGYNGDTEVLFSSDEDANTETNDYQATTVFDVVIQDIRPYLTLKLVDPTTENEITEVAQGQEVKAIVTLNSYHVGWMTMCFDIQYDGYKFKYKKTGTEDKGNLVYFLEGVVDPQPAIVEIAKTDDPASPLSVCFLGPDNMTLKDGGTSAEILELTLVAAGTGEDLQVGTSFKDNRNYVLGPNEEEVLVNEEEYIKTHESGSAEIEVTQSVFPTLSVSIEGGTEESEGTVALPRGGNFILKVNIDNYVEPWTMMSIFVDLNTKVYTVDTNNIVAFGGTATAVPMASGDKLGITIFSADGNDLYLSGGASSGTVLEIPITVKNDFEAAGSSFPITISSMEGGNLSQGAEVLFEESKLPVEQSVVVRGKPQLFIRKDQTTKADGAVITDDVAGENGYSVDQGDLIQFTVSVKDFASAWEFMTVKVAFEAGAFEVVPVDETNSATDAHPLKVEGGSYSFISDHDTNTLLATWINAEGNLMKSADNQDLMTFTLKVTGNSLTAEELEQAVSVTFLEGGNYADGDEVTNESYSDTPAEIQFTITKVASEVLVEISWGAMEFTYSYGTWDTTNHVWDGRGWNYNDENFITVTNQGAVNVTAEFAFNEADAMPDLTDTFKQDDAVVSSPLTVGIDGDETYPSTATVSLELGVLPENATLLENSTIIGAITVTIDIATHNSAGGTS